MKGTRSAIPPGIARRRAAPRVQASRSGLCACFPLHRLLLEVIDDLAELSQPRAEARVALNPERLDHSTDDRLTWRSHRCVTQSCTLRRAAQAARSNLPRGNCSLSPS